MGKVAGSDVRLVLDEFEDQLGDPGGLLDDQAVGGIGDMTSVTSAHASRPLRSSSVRAQVSDSLR
jgi:hypothetical protein